MAEFAPVAGIDVMEQLRDAGQLGSYHLWLAHDILRNRTRWARLAEFVRNNNPTSTIILDNSLIELGGAMSFQDIILACDTVKPTYLVLQDKLSDWKETVHLSAEMRHKLVMHYHLTRPGTDLPFLLLGVVQGERAAEMEQCARGLLLDSHVNMLSIPRVTVENLGSRVQVTNFIAERYPCPIHLLGFSDNVVDDIATAITCPQVKGIDSAMPIWAGENGHYMKHTQVEVGKRPKDYLDWKGYSKDTPVESNLKTLRRWLK